MNSIFGLWIIRAIHARSNGSRFVDDVAQCGGKNCPPFWSCKDKNISEEWLVIDDV
jgi:hypothetical protein